MCMGSRGRSVIDGGGGGGYHIHVHGGSLCCVCVCTIMCEVTISTLFVVVFCFGCYLLLCCLLGGHPPK